MTSFPLRSLLLSSFSLVAAPALLAGDVVSADLTAKPARTDKSQYTWFNPTPSDLLRELSPDRPDATESPLTVDAGRVAVEVSLFDYRRNNGDETFTVASTNVKFGLTNNTDLQVVFDTYSKENFTGGEEGFGDVQLRLKYNLWGNDGGDTALALFPFVKIPTGTALSNDEWEGGLIVPFSMSLTEGIGLGLMAEFDSVYNEDTGDQEFEFLHSAVLGFDVTERVGAFVEYVGISGKDDYEAYASGGLTYSVNENYVLDCGAQVGLNEAAEDFGLFAGFTKRF